MLTDGTNPLSPPRMATVDAGTTGGVTFMIDAGDLPDAAYTLGARIGTVNSPGTLDFTVDLTAPTAPIAPTKTNEPGAFITNAENLQGGFTIQVAETNLEANRPVELFSGVTQLGATQTVAPTPNALDFAFSAGDSHADGWRGYGYSRSDIRCRRQHGGFTGVDPYSVASGCSVCAVRNARGQFCQSIRW